MFFIPGCQIFGIFFDTEPTFYKKGNQFLEKVKISKKK